MSEKNNTVQFSGRVKRDVGKDDEGMVEVKVITVWNEYHELRTPAMYNTKTGEIEAQIVDKERNFSVRDIVLGELAEYFMECGGSHGGCGSFEEHIVLPDGEEIELCLTCGQYTVDEETGNCHNPECVK